jgi:hypothetical protein
MSLSAVLVEVCRSFWSFFEAFWGKVKVSFVCCIEVERRFALVVLLRRLSSWSYQCFCDWSWEFVQKNLECHASHNLYKFFCSLFRWIEVWT